MVKNARKRKTARVKEEEERDIVTDWRRGCWEVRLLGTKVCRNTTERHTFYTTTGEPRDLTHSFVHHILQIKNVDARQRAH